MEFLVYGLVDSRQPTVIRYIGKTSNARRALRLARHIYDAQRGEDTYKARWIRAVLKSGGAVVDVVITEAATDDEVKRLEVLHIARLRAAGAPLTNTTDGGDGTSGHPWTDERREKFRASMLGQKRSPEARQRMRDAKLGRRHTAEIRERMRAARAHLKGVPRSEEVRRRVSASKMGHPVSAETRRKIGDKQRAFQARRREMRWAS